jgi:putative ABC transport system permease protein
MEPRRWGDGTRGRAQRLASALLRASLPAEDAEFIVGDLEEELAGRLERGEPCRRAALWFWRQAVQTAWSVRFAGERPLPYRAGSRSLTGYRVHFHDVFARESRFAVRTLLTRPLFTLTAVLTIALGVGPTLAIYALVRSTLLRPLPFTESERLVFVWGRMDRSPSERVRLSHPDVADLRSRTTHFEAFAATNNLHEAALEPLGAEPEAIHLGRATPNFFDVLGVNPALGRLFQESDAVAGGEAPSGLILSDGLWRSRFGADPAVVGRTVLLDGASVAVRGVLPPDFELRLPPDLGLPARADAWVALPARVMDRSQARDLLARDQDSDNTGVVIGRLRPNATLQLAREDVARVASALRRELPVYASAGVHFEAESVEVDGLRHVRPLLIALLVGTMLVLLVAALNVAQLLLLQGVGREGETWVRIALGASRARLVLRSVLEAMLLAALGSAAGRALAQPVARLLQAQAPAAMLAQAPLVNAFAVAGATVAVAVLLALALSLAPAANVARAHQGRQRGSSASRRQARARERLVTAQVATAGVLLLGSLLLLRSAFALARVNPGFQADRALTFQLSLRDPARYRGPADRNLFTETLEEKLAALPGVESVGIGTILPLSGGFWTNPYGRAGEPPEAWLANEADYRMVTPGYLQALGVPVVAGRAFTRADDSERARVALVDEALARTLAGAGERPEAVVGRRMAFPIEGRPVDAEIIGVVGAVRHESLMEAGRATLYVPYRHEASRSVTVVVRARGPVDALATAARAAVREIDPHLPVQAMRPLTSYVSDAFAPARFALLLLGAFAATAVALSAVALYGTVSFAVSSRRREMAVRLALGEREGRLVRHVVRGAMRGVGAGILIAGLVAAPFALLLGKLLYQISPFDPVTWTLAAVVLVSIALPACAAPARRVARVAPLEALQRE